MMMRKKIRYTLKDVITDDYEISSRSMRNHINKYTIGHIFIVGVCVCVCVVTIPKFCKRMGYK